MAELEDFLKKLPPETQKWLNVVWGSLSATERTSMRALVAGFPTETNLSRMLVQLASTELKQAFGQKHRVAIVGPANVGKSTLYNQMIQNKHDRAEVSPLPGTTRVNQSADAGLFAVIDTPGADAVGEVGEREQAQALEAANNADVLVIVFDAIQGIKRTELELYHLLTGLGKPFVVVMNKTDLARRETPRIVEKAAVSLGLAPDQIIPVAARTGENLPQIIMAIASTEPGMVAALGQALPQYRWQLAWRSIVSAASVSAAIALTPLPILDFGPLVVTQSIMVLGIARIYNYKITLERARELVITFGLGFLGRTLFTELSKLGGIPGWILAASIAASTTVAMGYAATVWFSRGEKLSGESLKKITAQITTFLVDSLKSLGKKRDGQASLQKRIAELLEKSPLASSPKALELPDEPLQPEQPAVE